MNRTLPRRCIATFAFVLLLATAACTSTRAPGVPADTAAAHVIVLSLDGLPATTPGDGSMPTLDRLARDGTRAEWLVPAFPTLTFPNHYTLATGLRPDRHGIVHNTFRDPVLGDFVSKQNGWEGRWYGGEPIWATLQRQGGRAAAIAWIGGQDPRDPRVPALMLPFEDGRTIAAHIDQLLAWLDLPGPERPRLLMNYFQQYDVAAHAHGPASPEAAAVKSALDAGLARLVDGLEARGLLDRVDLIVLSDHGMRAMPPENVALLDQDVPADAYEVVGGSLVGVFPHPGREREVERLLGRRAHHACHRKEEVPAHWAYGTHPRVPPIVCLPDPGWYLFAREPQRRYARVRGEHGFDIDDPEMRAVFVARGPSFRRGATIPAFDNVDVYPLLAHLLGIEPAPGDGRLDTAGQALRVPAH
jgi:predicted AlkP superfamily pyrophosphatase or phosphodiesterase